MSDLERRKRAPRKPAQPSKIIIAFAVNDPDTGMFANECAGIDFPGDFLELFSWWRPRRFRTEEDAIILSGKRWPVVGYKYGYGNWCWDAYWMTPEVAAQFLRWLRSRGLFNADCGWSEIFEWFKGEGPELPEYQLIEKLIEAQQDQKP